MPNQKKNEYDNQYVRDNYHRISLNIKKDEFDELKAAADKNKESVNGFIKSAISNCIKGSTPKEPTAGGNSWIPIVKRPMTNEEKAHFSDMGWEIFDGLIIISTLPEEDEDVLISLSDGSVRIDTLCYDYGCYYFDSTGIDDVVAWMSLPEPYKITKKESN